MTADTHVHFLSPQTARLEAEAEGVNVVNLLASQWGDLFTNVGDFTGAVSGVSHDDTIVWVGTENRQHALGHVSLLGPRGSLVSPLCAGGPDESYLGDEACDEPGRVGGAGPPAGRHRRDPAFPGAVLRGDRRHRPGRRRRGRDRGLRPLDRELRHARVVPRCSMPGSGSPRSAAPTR